MKHIAFYFFCSLLFFFFLQGCMHVKNIEGTPENSSEKVSIELNRLNNMGGGLIDDFYSVIESDTYYITAGYSNSDLSALNGGSNTSGGYDFILSKINKSDLSLVNINNLGGTGWDYLKSVIESGNYYIAVGYSQSNLSAFTGGTASAGNYDFVIAKFNKSDLSLDRINNLGGTVLDEFTSIIESDGYYIAVGRSSSDLSALTGGGPNLGGNDFVIAKLNKTDLSLVTLNYLGGTSTDEFCSIIESDNYYICIGNSRSDLSGLSGGSTNCGGGDFVIAKFNKSDLSLVSINNLGGTTWDYLESVIESGNYYIAVGYSMSDLSSLTGGSNTIGGNDFVIARFNKADLSLVNLNNFGGTSSDNFCSIIESPSCYVAIGASYSNLSNFSGGTPPIGSSDFVISKLNKVNLSLIELNNLGGASQDSLTSGIESDSHYIAIGQSQSDLSDSTGGSTNTGSSDFVIVKFGD